MHFMSSHLQPPHVLGEPWPRGFIPPPPVVHVFGFCRVLCAAFPQLADSNRVLLRRAPSLYALLVRDGRIQEINLSCTRIRPTEPLPTGMLALPAQPQGRSRHRCARVGRDTPKNIRNGGRCPSLQCWLFAVHCSDNRMY